MNQVAMLRDHSGWILRGIVKGGLETAETRIALDEEYWLALRHPAEVESVGRALLAAGDPGFSKQPDGVQNQLWREFRAYIRQAEGFYRGASVLPWKSSPLNYYYSIMNLAKASAVSRGALAPRAAPEPRRLRHGLAAHVRPGSPDAWRLVVRGTEEVFSTLYAASVGLPIPDAAELDGRRLLGYVPDITWQLDKSGNEDLKAWFACKWVIATAPGQYWDVIVVPRRMPLDRLPSALGESYCEVAPEASRDFALRTLGWQGLEAVAFRFLERRVPINGDLVGSDGSELDRLLRESMPNCVFELTDVRHEFSIGLPYPTPSGPIPMNELIAAYAVMFFLSSLVRYHPDYMDAIGESVDAWLIETFAKSAPLTLLRHLTSLVLGKTLIFKSV